MFRFPKRRKPLEYPCIEPPFQVKRLGEMNRQEARQHFEWFVSQSESLRKLLLSAIDAACGTTAECDYSPESLVPLWVCMSRFFEARPITAEERQSLIDNLPPVARNHKKFENPKELSTATACYATDIGFYLAEVFIRRYPQVHWTLWMDKGHAFNRPALAGFRLVLIPVHLVSGCIWDQLRCPKDTWLFEAYKHWEQKNLLRES
jgi:hypothetical protein